MPRRKVFISYYQGDEDEVNEFIELWDYKLQVILSRALGTFDNDDFIDSNSPDYVMSQIRERYLEDSTVTIVLLGSCTHSRRYVDWELKSSLRQSADYAPNGLLGILLPSSGDSAVLPQRFSDNWERGEQDCYARYRAAPTNATQLAGWVEDAFSARYERAHLIQNSSEMMRYNSKCKHCNITH